MVNVLDNKDNIKSIDKSSVYESLISLPLQCKDAWQAASKVEIPNSYLDFKNIVFCGMGGSGLAARVIESAFFEKLKVPIIRINDYNLPPFVNNKSLVVCSSYSGTTEETLENAKQAIQRKAKWLAVSTGKDLITLAEKEGVPYYQIKPTHNPCNQPRMAVGYSIVGQLALASKLKIIDIKKEDIQKAISIMKDVIKLNRQEIKSDNNPAKKLALKIQNRIIILISASHLIGATHIFNNQLNENSKVFSSDFVIPELNHHLMEGLKNPLSNKKTLFFIFIDSDLYSPKIKKRFEITKDVVNKNKVGYQYIKMTSRTKLEQVFELIQFGAFVNFYLAMLYKQDPAPIPWVDYFKKQLSGGKG